MQVQILSLLTVREGKVKEIKFIHGQGEGKYKCLLLEVCPRIQLYLESQKTQKSLIK